MLFRGGDAPMASFSPEQIQAHMQKWGVWMTKLFEEERVLSSEPLFPTGRTLQGPKLILTDGPFLEGKEMVGGYLMCLAESLDEATEIAKGCPILEFDDATVEIREINKMEIPS